MYIFTRTSNVWSQVAYVKATYPNLQAFIGSFGSSLAFDGTTLAVGAGDNNCARGFNPSPGSNDCPGSGAVYLFSRTATSWAQRAFVKASNAEAGDSFGSFYDNSGVLAIDGNTLAVGAPEEQSCATGINGNQNDNGCGVIMVFGPGPSGGMVPSRAGVGAVYVYSLQ